MASVCGRSHTGACACTVLCFLRVCIGPYVGGIVGGDVVGVCGQRGHASLQALLWQVR